MTGPRTHPPSGVNPLRLADERGGFARHIVSGVPWIQFYQSEIAHEMTNKDDFFERVWDVVAMIPPGKVTTYGHIAEFIGVRSAARTVGWALNAAAGAHLPCHRVVNRFGALSGRRHFEGPDVMEERLRSEGVSFNEDGCVDLSKHLWVPSR